MATTKRVLTAMAAVVALSGLLVVLIPVTADAADTKPFDIPIAGAVMTQDFGEYNPAAGGYHTGVDWSNGGSNVAIAAAADGWVDSYCTGYCDGFGNHVVLRHVRSSGQTVYTVYGHMADGSLTSNAMKPGTCMTKGARLGYEGATGNVTGPHLHFEIKDSPGLGPDFGYSSVSDPRTRGYYDPYEVMGSWQLKNCGTTTDNNPIGNYDLLKSPSAGRVRVGGWAFDPNAKTQSVSIHVYIGGPAGADGVEGHNIGKAEGHRPDVGDAYSGVGDNHGFDAVIDTKKTGSQQVCVYAINIGAGSNKSLGCKTVTIANPNPVGAYDTATNPTPGRVRITGWAFDRSDLADHVRIHAYVGGPAGAAGAEGHNLGDANLHRPDVDDAYPGVGDYHGFRFTFASDKTGNQQVCVYAINLGYGTKGNTPLGCKTVNIAPCSTGFSDVPQKHEFCPDILWAVNDGVADGYPDDTYRPTYAVTRGSMAAFLYRLDGSPAYTPPATPSFGDVPTSHVFRKEIEWLNKEGVTGGYDDGGYHPNDDVTRGSMAAFLYRMAGSPAFTPPSTPTFDDVPKSHPFYKEIEWLASTKVTTGFADGGFHPTEAVSRQSMAAFLHRYSDL